jgi:lipoprotein-releasing system permease protein
VRFTFFIAFRYLFSKKRIQIISLISWISVLGVFVGTAALVVLLSAFNGLEGWVIRLYNSFDADLRIESTQGKWIDNKRLPIAEIRQIDGVWRVAEVLEENCLLMYDNDQFVCTMKGVSEEFSKMTGIDTMMVAGKFRLNQNGHPQVVVGSGIAYSLSMSLNAIDKPLILYVPKSKIGETLNPADAFYSESIFPSGIFEIQPEFDTRYVIVPMAFAQSLLHNEEKLTAVEIQLKPGANPTRVAEQLKALLGSNYSVKNRFEQHELLYKIINAEKWAVFLVLCFILLIAVFNVTGSLTMLVVEKSRDIRTLQSMGADQGLIKRIFFTEGMMISGLGMLGGLACGILVLWLQEKYSMVLINGEDPYPVLVRWQDLLAICATVLAIGALAAWLPASRAVDKRSLNN